MSTSRKCGKRPNDFEDSSSSLFFKKIRSSSTPTHTDSSSPSSQFAFNLSISSSHLDHLALLFPHITDKQILERVLKECGDDLDSAIRSLNELRLGTAENMGSDGSLEENIKLQNPATSENPSAPINTPTDGAQWVELLVRGITSTTNMDEARNHASRALEQLEKFILGRATSEASRGLQQENIILKEQSKALIQENNILKRAVSIQHERQKDFVDKIRELDTLKQMVSQYQEQLSRLEVNNYALRMHLQQAQQSNPISGCFHPDVF